MKKTLATATGVIATLGLTGCTQNNFPNEAPIVITPKAKQVEEEKMENTNEEVLETVGELQDANEQKIEEQRGVPAETEPEVLENVSETPPEEITEETPEDTPEESESDEVVEETEEVPTAPTSMYKSGTYSNTLTYNSPGGRDEVTINLSIENDVVTNASIAVVKAHHESREYINRFSNGLSAAVVGKTVSEAKSVQRISGSSLTTGAFKKAVAAMEAEAKNS